MRALFKQFSFPGGIPSHVAPETPGSIHEGGELGYALSHAFGAAFDNPGWSSPAWSATARRRPGRWHQLALEQVPQSGPRRRRAAVPAPERAKIAGPTVLARIPHDELEALFRGYGWEPLFVEGRSPRPCTRRWPPPRPRLDGIARIQKEARTKGYRGRPRWPMIVLRSPKGWTGPKTVDGRKIEGTHRAHQVPMATWTGPGTSRSSPTDEGLPPRGALRRGRAAAARAAASGAARYPSHERQPARQRRGAHARPAHARLPRLRGGRAGARGGDAEATRVQGELLRDVMKLNLKPGNFRIFGPDETASNPGAPSSRSPTAASSPRSRRGRPRRPDGRVMEMLSEHQCQAGSRATC